MSQAWWDEHYPQERPLREEAVTACVHDHLIDPAYRGPAVPFADKADQLARFVRQWASPLQGHPAPRVRRLGRRMLACPPYDAGVRPVDMAGRPPAPAGACRSAVCPHCYARRVDYAHRSLDYSGAGRYLNGVSVIPHVQTASLVAARKGLRLARQRMLRLDGIPDSPYAVVLARIVRFNDKGWRYQLAALNKSEASQPFRLGRRDAGWVDGRVSCPLDHQLLKQIMVKAMSYWVGLTKPDLIRYLPTYDWVVTYRTLIT